MDKESNPVLPDQKAREPEMIPNQPIDTAAIAKRFAQILQTWLTADQWRAMRLNNATKYKGTDICGSHDYCDANMAMLDALTDFEIGAQFDPANDADCLIWNTAWTVAKNEYLTATPEEVAAPPVDYSLPVSDETRKERIADQINNHLSGDDVFASAWNSGGGIHVITISFAEASGEKRVLIFGNSCETWGADVYPTAQDEENCSNSLDPLWTDLDSENSDPLAVAIAFYRAWKEYKTVHDTPEPAHVFDYCTKHLHIIPSRKDLNEFPMNSVCGEACKQIVDRAVALLEVCDPIPEIRNPIKTAAIHAVEIVCFG